MKPCPHCGQLMPGSTPAQPVAVAPAAEHIKAVMDEQRALIKEAIERMPLHGDRSPPKKTYETWHDRPPLT